MRYCSSEQGVRVVPHGKTMRIHLKVRDRRAA
jgi:hypothetical protein